MTPVRDVGRVGMGRRSAQKSRLRDTARP